MRKTAMVILLGGLFLLMLSALVVTPEDAAPPAVPSAPGQYHAVFALPAQPPAPVSAGLTAHKAQTGLIPSAAEAVVPEDWRSLGARDSNGRVLRAARYENSVYEVFRPEIAGG